jgi:hypothetical protein
LCSCEVVSFLWLQVVDMERVFQAITVDVIGRHGFAQEWNTCSAEDWGIVNATDGMSKAMQAMSSVPFRNLMFWDKVGSRVLHKCCS